MSANQRVQPFLMRRQSGPVISPTLGKDWFLPTTQPPNRDYLGIATNGSRLVMVADGGTNPVATSDDLGDTWTQRTATNVRWRAVDYSPDLDLFCAVSISGTSRVMTSPDGETWTDRTASQANSWLGVCWGNGLFVAVASSGTNRVMTSPDGVNWTNRTAASASDWRYVKWIPDLSLFVAVGNGVCMTSPNGITWTSRTFSSVFGLEIAFNGSNLVSSNFNISTQIAKYSSDGINWNNSSVSPNSAGGASVVFGQGKFVALRYNDIHISTDNGQTFSDSGVTNPTLPSCTYTCSIYLDGRIIAVNNSDNTITLSE